MRNVGSKVVGTGLLVAVLGCVVFLAFMLRPVTEAAVTTKHLSDVPDASWERLATRKLYFGHQSVGGNIVDGLREILKDNPEIRLRIATLSDSLVPKGPGLLESKIGKNGDPASKTDRFAELIASGLATNGSVLFHKYCYGDFWDPAGPKVRDAFEHYKITMARLRRENPEIMFVHFTIPLGYPKLSFKAQIRKMLGGEINEYGTNQRNNEFNDLMRAEYAGKEPLFDLARFEATRPDGSPETFTYRGRAYETLVPEYTDDDGHLNEAGRRRIAEQLLVFLAELPDR